MTDMLDGRRQSTSGMATEVHSDRQPRDVRRIDFDIDRQCGHDPTQPLGADSEAVDEYEELTFQVPEVRPWMTDVDRPQDRLLGEQRRPLERSADPDANNDWRARVG